MWQHATDLFNKISSELFDERNNIYYSIIPDKNYYLAKNNGYLYLDYNKCFNFLREHLLTMQEIEIADLLKLEDFYYTDTHWKQQNLEKILQKFAESMNFKISTSFVEKSLDVNFYGVYNRNQLPEIFSKHDVLVVPSIWWENSPMVIQESFMAKTPVLCSNIGGMKEKIIDGKNGWYFKVGDSNDLSEKINYFFENIGIFNNENFKVKNIKEDIKNLLKIYKDIV